MKRTILLALAAVAAGGLEAGVADVGKLLSTRVLSDESAMASHEYAYSRLVEADLAADERWATLATRGEYDVYRRELREKMIAAVGGFPEKTPLNAKSVPAFEGNGYRVENVIFESMPGVYVTGNFYVPTDRRFTAPYPAVLVTCGHSHDGKNSPTYERACVQLAKAGFAAFIYDPYFQGERQQLAKYLGPCPGHNRTGVRALLVGWSMSRLRIWDGIRAIDYVTSRPDVDAQAIGYMGNSGGGTMTSLMMAVDKRIRCAAPSCYLTNFRTLCLVDSPQDAEQNIFGQLSFGLNHLGYVLMLDIPVAVTGRYGDFFPYSGTLDTFSRARAVATRLGAPSRYALDVAAGPHGWTESTRAASVDWMRRNLKFEQADRPFDMADYRGLDIGFDESAADCGIPPEKGRCAPKGQVMNLPGFRSIFRLMRDESERLAAARKGLSADERKAAVISRSRLRMPCESGLAVTSLGQSLTNSVTVERLVVHNTSGYAFPAVLLTPAESKAGLSPLLCVGDSGRAAFAEEASAALAEGRAVLAADLFGFGEIGKHKFTFYGQGKNRDECAAMILYLLGETAVGVRAGEIMVLAEFLKGRCSKSVTLSARGSVAIAAAHAYAAEREVFESVRLADAPRSWTDLLADSEMPYSFADVVPGALSAYDWTDLVSAK